MNINLKYSNKAVFSGVTPAGVLNNRVDASKPVELNALAYLKAMYRDLGEDFVGVSNLNGSNPWYLTTPGFSKSMPVFKAYNSNIAILSNYPGHTQLVNGVPKKVFNNDFTKFFALQSAGDMVRTHKSNLVALLSISDGEPKVTVLSSGDSRFEMFEFIV